MAYRAFAIACASCVLLVHGGDIGVITAGQSDRSFQHRIDAASGTGYLVEVPKSIKAISAWQWQKKVALTTPVGLAAGWLIKSQLHLGRQHKESPDQIAIQEVEEHCRTTLPRWWFAVVLIVLGMGSRAVKRRRQKGQGPALEVQVQDAAKPTVAEVKMFRIFTEPADGCPEPCHRSLTEMSAWSEQSLNVDDDAELFRMQTPQPKPSIASGEVFSMQTPRLKPPLSYRSMSKNSTLAKIDAETSEDDNSLLTPPKFKRAVTADRSVQLNKVLSPRHSGRTSSMKLIGDPKDKIQELARQLSQSGVAGC
mmetsp:Transcript_22158/g.39838  ORF Transcript_22158/g.39838 Transcript_22158/m.39838 type:complete len:309 (+) Transcript_22158:75-1001(+)